MIAEEEPGAVDVHEGDEDHGEGAGAGCECSSPPYRAQVPLIAPESRLAEYASHGDHGSHFFNLYLSLQARRDSDMSTARGTKLHCKLLK